MKHVLAALAASIALAACDETPPVEAGKADAGGYEVRLLLEHDGCKLYYVPLRNVYFSKCAGAHVSRTSWTESCGKNCRRSVSVSTSGGV